MKVLSRERVSNKEYHGVPMLDEDEMDPGHDQLPARGAAAFGKGDNAKQNKKMKELQEKAESGDVEAMWQLGKNYYHRTGGFQQNYELAYLWQKKAHDAGSAKATAYLGDMLVKGFGVTKNPQVGFAYLGVAAKESDFAAYVLGMAFADGKYGLPTDVGEARRVLGLITNGSCPHRQLTEDFVENAREKLEELKNQ